METLPMPLDAMNGLPNGLAEFRVGSPGEILALLKQLADGNVTLSLSTPAGHQAVEVLEPGFGQRADLGIVDEDALHDAALELALVAAELVAGRGVLELRDQHRAGALELDDLVPVAAAGGLEHLFAGLLDGLVVLQQGGVHGGVRSGHHHERPIGVSTCGRIAVQASCSGSTRATHSAMIASSLRRLAWVRRRLR